MSTSTTTSRTTAAGRSHPRAEIVCTPAVDARTLADHFRIRRAVFVDEQHLFPGSDRDPHDDEPDVVHVLASIGTEPVGTVRLFPLDAAGQLWQGDRLAVLPGRRVHGAGAPLVRFAVAHAARAGGRRMVAHIQPPNVLFFRRLGWTCSGPVESYLGAEHQPMGIDLPRDDPADDAPRV